MPVAKSILAPLIFALAVQCPSAALACRVGGDRILFTEAPTPDALTDARTIKVRFTNVGPDIEHWKKLRPWVRDDGDFGGLLIGVGRPLDRKRAETFPIYATVTSCTHGFWSMNFGKADPVWDGEYYLVGRFQSDKGGRYFRAAGNWNGRWHYGF